MTCVGWELGKSNFRGSPYKPYMNIQLCQLSVFFLPLWIYSPSINSYKHEIPCNLFSMTGEFLVFLFLLVYLIDGKMLLIRVGVRSNELSARATVPCDFWIQFNSYQTKNNQYEDVNSCIYFFKILLFSYTILKLLLSHHY